MTNPQADYQGNDNNAIGKAPDNYASSYLDDVLIYCDSDDEHGCHGKWVMELFLDTGMYVKPEQCQFHKDTM